MRKEGFRPMAFTPQFRRYAQKRKGQTHCHTGHPLTSANTREELCIRNGKEYVVRICKACERERQRKKHSVTWAVAEGH